MSRYLITGVAGFIGSSLARALLQHGHCVRGVDNFATGNRENISEILPSIDFREVDILDRERMRDACESMDYVLHDAAIPSVPRSVQDPWETNRADVDGTISVLIAARDAKVKRVVYAASSSAYGETPTLPKQESMLPDPISPYAVAKLAGEYYMKSFYQCYGLETVSLRYFNVFGPRQDAKSAYSGVLAKFISLMLACRQPVIFGDGGQSRDFTYIDNVVSANLAACESPAAEVAGRVFNIACGVRTSLNEIVEILRHLTEYHGEAIYREERAGDVKHSVADITLARHHLGYQPRVNLAEGLKRTVLWYREHLPEQKDVPHNVVLGSSHC